MSGGGVAAAGNGGSTRETPPPASVDSSPVVRYECKYLIEDDLLDWIREFVRPFVRTDPFLEARGTPTYPICSLYLDTPGLDLYRQTQGGVKNRFKLRIRSYSDDIRAPLYLEIKRRLTQVVEKHRCQIDRASAVSIAGGGFPGRPLPVDSAVADEFVALASATACRPVLRVKYWREAYESISGDPIRLTFDSGLCHCVTLDPCTRLDGDAWYPTPLPGTILEIKFTDRYPSWVGRLIESFDLQRISVPKYCLSMERALREGAYSPQLTADLPSFLGGAF